MPQFYGRDEEICARKNSELFNFGGRILISASFSPGKQVLHLTYALFASGIRPKILYGQIHINLLVPIYSVINIDYPVKPPQ